MRAISTLTPSLLLALAACSGETGGGDDDAGGGGGMDAAGTDGGTPTGDGGTGGDAAPGDAGPFSVDDAGFVLCGTERCACSKPACRGWIVDPEELPELERRLAG
jgi:hypothetical protein